MSLIRRTNPLGELMSVRAALNRLFESKQRQVQIKAADTPPRAPRAAATEGHNR
jgi:hypothetical protein